MNVKFLDLEDLRKRIKNCHNRIVKLKKLNAPKDILKTEYEMLRDYQDRLARLLN